MVLHVQQLKLYLPDWQAVLEKEKHMSSSPWYLYLERVRVVIVLDTFRHGHLDRNMLTQLSEGRKKTNLCQLVSLPVDADPDRKLGLERVPTIKIFWPELSIQILLVVYLHMINIESLIKLQFSVWRLRQCRIWRVGLPVTLSSVLHYFSTSS